jgi:hypothetical protein
LCAAQEMSESQILGADCSWGRYPIQCATLYNLYPFCAAVAWHEA